MQAGVQDSRRLVSVWRRPGTLRASPPWAVLEAGGVHWPGCRGEGVLRLREEASSVEPALHLALSKVRNGLGHKCGGHVSRSGRVS